jgi:hypothetical protein
MALAGWRSVSYPVPSESSAPQFLAEPAPTYSINVAGNILIDETPPGTS